MAQDLATTSSKNYKKRLLLSTDYYDVGNSNVSTQENQLLVH